MIILASLILACWATLSTILAVTNPYKSKMYFVLALLFLSASTFILLQFGHLTTYMPPAHLSEEHMAAISQYCAVSDSLIDIGTGSWDEQGRISGTVAPISVSAWILAAATLIWASEGVWVWLSGYTNYHLDDLLHTTRQHVDRRIDDLTVEKIVKSLREGISEERTFRPRFNHLHPPTLTVHVFHHGWTVSKCIWGIFDIIVTGTIIYFTNTTMGFTSSNYPSYKWIEHCFQNGVCENNIFPSERMCIVKTRDLLNSIIEVPSYWRGTIPFSIAVTNFWIVMHLALVVAVYNLAMQARFLIKKYRSSKMKLFFNYLDARDKEWALDILNIDGFQMMMLIDEKIKLASHRNGRIEKLAKEVCEEYLSFM